MPVEESVGQRGLALFKKATDHEGEKAIEQEKNDDENVGDGRGKIRQQFAPGDGFNVSERVHDFASRAVVSGMVMLRKTSSRRPSSVRKPSICQPLVASKTSRVR